MIPRCQQANSGAGRVSGTAGEARTLPVPDRVAEAACRYVELARPCGREKERGMSSIPAIRLASFVLQAHPGRIARPVLSPDAVLPRETPPGNLGKSRVFGRFRARTSPTEAVQG